MKRSDALTLIITGAVIFAIGAATASIGEGMGGNFFRAFENSRMEFKDDRKKPEFDYDYGNGGGYEPDDDIAEFFRSFGMSDEEIERFLNPYGSSGGGRDKKEGRIYY